MSKSNNLGIILFISTVFITTTFIGYSTPISAQTPSAQTSQELIGRVIKTSGVVQARSLNGDLRPLSRRSEIYLKDTIITSADGFAQVRLIDQGMVAFLAETEFTFEEYSYDGPGGEADNAIMTMVRGGFRTISGKIGDDDQDNYQVDTPFASIGIRGTTHEALIADNTLYTGVYDGGTTVYNGQGSVNTGFSASFDFTQTRFGEAPEGLLQQPTALGETNYAMASSNAATEEETEPAAIIASADLAPPTSLTQLSNFNNNLVTGNNLDGAINPAEGLRPENVNFDKLLSDEELASLSNNSFLVGNANLNLAGEGARNTTPIFRESTSNVIYTTEPTDDAQIAITQVQTLAEFNLSWERWEGPLASFSDNNQPDLWNQVIDSVAYFSTFDVAISNNNQRGHFSEVLAWIGEDESGTGINAENSRFSFDVNFQTGSISNGELLVYLDQQNTTERWLVFFEGSVNNNYADFTVQASGQSSYITTNQGELDSQVQLSDNSGSVSFSTLTGDFQGAFINQGEEFLGSFNFYSDNAIGNNGAEQIQRLFGQVLSAGEIENRFTLAEEELLDGAGLALSVGLNADIFQVISDSDASNNNPLLVENSAYPASRVFRKGDADIVGFESLVGNNLYGLSWGIFWANGPHALLNPVNTTDPEFIETYDKLLWLTVNDPLISSFTGSTTYSATGDFLGTSNAGSVSGVESAFDINFATGRITDGYINICVNGNGCSDAITWQMSFANSNSSISNGYLQATDLTGEMINTNGDSTSVSNSAFSALFTYTEHPAGESNITDAAPSGVAAGLNLATANNDFVSVAYLSEREERINSNQLNSMRNQVALIVETGVNGDVLFGSSTDTSNPVIGLNPGLSFNNPNLLRQDFAQVRSASISSQENPNPDFELGWGLWDQNSIVQQTDPSSATTTLAATNDQLWAAMAPADIADLNGQWSYGGSNLAVTGNSSDGAITQLDMGFDVSFATGTISNGTLSATTASSSWSANYNGNVNGSFAQMTGISGTYTNSNAVTSDVSGADIAGVFIGTGSTQGFVSGFTLSSGTDYIEGLGLLIRD